MDTPDIWCQMAKVLGSLTNFNKVLQNKISNQTYSNLLHNLHHT